MDFPPQRDPLSALRLTGCFVLALVFFSACLLPLLYLNLAKAALTNLHLSPTAAVGILFGMLLGSPINLPIKQIPLEHEVLLPVFGPVGGWSLFPQFQRLRQVQTIAVNVGGCVIPVLLAIWLMCFIVTGGHAVMLILLVGILLNTAVCFLMARPIPGLGIGLPVFLPALVAFCVTWLGLPTADDQSLRPPVAFVIGISGPLVGADLLHWKDFKKIAPATVSIGGAGTWDAIVLSGLLAALVAG